MKIHVKINREYIFDFEPEIQRLKGWGLWLKW
jgi:hypothetical protein